MKFQIESPDFNFQELYETLDLIISVIKTKREFHKNNAEIHSPKYSPNEPCYHQKHERQSPSAEVYQKVDRKPQKFFSPFSPKAKKEPLAFSPYSPIKYT